MNLNKKIELIQSNARLAAKVLQLDILEQTIWKDFHVDGFIFSWMVCQGFPLIGIKKEAIHLGLVLTPEEIENHYEEMTVDWFLMKFNEELNKQTLIKPEEEQKIEVVND